MHTLKILRSEAFSAALEKARRYRLLGEPDDAESICLDILAVEPNHQEALSTLLLALTDKFTAGQLNPAFTQAKDLVARLDSSYSKNYYLGIIYERRAKHHLKQGGPGIGAVAHHWFVKAMDAYNEALDDNDPKNQEALLRWNSCARILNNNPEVKADDTSSTEMLLDAYDTPH
jgi:hypothetical protein